MKILGINHIGVAPKDAGQSASFFGAVLKLQNQGSETVEDQKVKVDFFLVPKDSDTRIEILEPVSPESPIQKFLDKKGSGLHHMALEVDDIEQWLKYLKAEGVKLIDETPRTGAHNTKIAFVHPHSTGGLLVELVQEQNNA